MRPGQRPSTCTTTSWRNIWPARGAKSSSSLATARSRPSTGRRPLSTARAIRDAVQDLGLNIRAGLHTGDVEMIDRDVHGIAVHFAARLWRSRGPERGSCQVRSPRWSSDRGSSSTTAAATKSRVYATPGRSSRCATRAIKGGPDKFRFRDVRLSLRCRGLRMIASASVARRFVAAIERERQLSDRRDRHGAPRDSGSPRRGH